MEALLQRAISKFLGRHRCSTAKSQEVYHTLLARVTGTVSPKDIIEEIWVHDIVDLVWEILRVCVD